MNYTGRSWTLTLPPGTKLLTSNDHLSWQARWRRTQELRATFGWLARAQRIPRLQAAHAEFFVMARGRHDPSNWSDTGKAAIDGCTDAGAWPDDSWKYVIGPDPRHWDQPGFRLVIRELAGLPD